jgi:hypothetical protein
LSIKMVISAGTSARAAIKNRARLAITLTISCAVTAWRSEFEVAAWTQPTARPPE